MKVVAVIVTYNRKDELTRCIKAVMNQSYKVDSIVVVNNASTDDTKEVVEKNFPQVHLINLEKNSGGSGGFFTGLKYSHENLNPDFYWLMDDDGYPTDNCLEMLMSKSSQYDYVMPASVNIDNSRELSWPVRKRNKQKTSDYEELKSSWGSIMDFVTPFNGVLLSKKCIESVGYIDPKFFIWGDEYDHYWRCIQNQITPVTYLDAVFYHPAQKLPLVKILFGLLSVPYTDSKLRMFCLARNYTYIYRHYNQRYRIPIKWIMYFWLFHFTRHNDKEGWNVYKKAVKDGFREEFTGHIKYLELKNA